MAFKLVFASLLAVAACNPVPYKSGAYGAGYGASGYGGSSGYAGFAAPGAYSGAPGYGAHEPEAPAKYEFAYQVADPHTGDIKSQSEVADGNSVHGAYSFVEADGTTRIVEYADEGHGFNAIVKKEGIPAPPPAPVHAAPAPVYPVPAPVHAAPVVAPVAVVHAAPAYPVKKAGFGYGAGYGAGYGSGFAGYGAGFPGFAGYSAYPGYGAGFGGYGYGAGNGAGYGYGAGNGAGYGYGAGNGAGYGTGYSGYSFGAH